MIKKKETTPICILLVDDHDVVRSGLRMLLSEQENLVIVGEARTGMEAVNLAQSLEPDIIIMDITLPDISGIEATRLIQESSSRAKIIALTIHEDEQFFFEMLQVGAAGYVPKRAAPEDLLNAIHQVYAGEVYIYPSLAKLLVEDFLERADKESITRSTMNELTPREQEVLMALADGYTNDEIADKLAISRHTVARHRENVMRKLGMHSRTELVKYAIRKGLVNP